LERRLLSETRQKNRSLRLTLHLPTRPRGIPLPAGDENPNHWEDFERLLGKAAKPQNSVN
jgi:hypothetical protein